ncbi:MAG: InlB B-repeat-containing protein [Erysipelotrichaceae bacterium]|nr:InlB B-repeat-containing protein [Erysipelotrichaceae bacterium]
MKNSIYFKFVLTPILICFMFLSGFSIIKAEETYTVTYTDPSKTFEEQVYVVNANDPIPAFEGSLQRDGYVFSTWNGKYKNGEQTKETVTTNRIFSARWVAAPKPLDNATTLSKGQIRATDEFRQNGSFDIFNVKLIDSTFTLKETTWDEENQKYIASILITDPNAYEVALEEVGKKYGMDNYVFNQEKTPEENLIIHFSNKKNYKGNASYSNLEATFGGWLLDSAYYPGSSRSQLLFNLAYGVTFKDGADGAAFETYTASTVETAKGEASVASFEPKRYGYIFTGWTSENEKLLEDGRTITGNDVLTAQWQVNKYTVSFEGYADSQTVEYGKTVIKPQDPIKEGYTFVGWYLNDEAYDFNTPVKENIELTAKFTKNSSNPDTSDSGMYTQYLAMMGMSAAAIFLVMKKRFQ